MNMMQNLRNSSRVFIGCPFRLSCYGLSTMQASIPKPDPLVRKDISKDALSLGFLGGGQMGCALCCSIIRPNRLLSGSSIIVTDKHQSCLDTINAKTKPILDSLNIESNTMIEKSNDNDSKNNENSSNNRIKVNTTLNNRDVINSDIVVLSIKPQNTKTVLSELREYWTGNHLLCTVIYIDKVEYPCTIV